MTIFAIETNGNQKPVTMRNRWLTLPLLFAGLALLTAACSTLTAAERAQQEKEIAQQVEKALAERQYTISVNMMYPLRGTPVNVTPDYSLQVKGDSLFSYLPYFGRAYNIPYGGGNGLHFSAPIKGYESAKGKKGRTRVTIQVENEGDQLTYNLDLFPNGRADIDVISRERESINYSGEFINQ